MFETAEDLVAAFADRRLSPVEMTKAALERIEQFNKQLNAFTVVTADEAIEQAKQSEQRYMDGKPAGLLDGVPVALKDVFLQKGYANLKGSKLFDPNDKAKVDAPVVANLRKHGAVFTGRTTTPEFGWKGITDSPLQGITRNPWDPHVTSGGSSGGSGVAVAMGMSTLSPGTDGGGSVRIPGSFCGLCALKPTYGRIPLWPAAPYGTLAHAGPMAWTVADAARMLDVLAEPDARDWTALPPQRVKYRESLDRDLTGLRIALSENLGYVDVDDEVRAAVAKAAKVFEQLGATVEAMDPGFDDPIESFAVLWNSGVAQAARHYTAEQRKQMDPGLQEILADGERYTSVDYVQAMVHRNAIGERMSRFHETYDLLLTPTMPILPFEAGREVPEGWPHKRWTSWARFSYPFNMTQQPALTVPCGFSASGLPIGLQIIGAKYHDALVLRAGHAYQQAAPLTDRRPSLAA